MGGRELNAGPGPLVNSLTHRDKTLSEPKRILFWRFCARCVPVPPCSHLVLVLLHVHLDLDVGLIDGERLGREDGIHSKIKLDLSA